MGMCSVCRANRGMDGWMNSICNYHPQPLTKGDEFKVHCRHPQAD